MKFFNTVKFVNITVRADNDNIKEATINALRYAIQNIESGTTKIDREYKSYSYKMDTSEI